QDDDVPGNPTPKWPAGGACAPGCGANCASSGNNAVCPKASRLYGRYVVGSGGGVNGATNATPIEITTSSDHGLSNGAQVVISGVLGNLGANGPWTVTKTANTKFTLNGSAGTGNYTASAGDRWDQCDGNCGGDLSNYDAVVFPCVG